MRNRGNRRSFHPRGFVCSLETSMKLSGKKILILAARGFEQSELEVPRDRLKAAGATVHIVSPEGGEIMGWELKDWGRAVKGSQTHPPARAGRHRGARLVAKSR